MSISVVKQYSVFLVNEPGALKNFAELFVKERVSLIAISQDVRFDAAVVRVAVNYNAEISHALTKAATRPTAWAWPMTSATCFTKRRLTSPPFTAPAWETDARVLSSW